ncbi:receptor-like protein Cf-9 [Lactuca sativa]|uniref:receptor-like protein Cf-9 n=1 Tax=Lactuca sativa TaxID=4236 RepID=UPI001C68D9AB|nr:receptor-like protein Cf-9 [Lactuca sativa]
MNWSTSIDCCNWDGITCNHFTGDVIGIDLSYGMLQGTIHPNTTLFDLPHLQRLNLAYNNFNASQLPREIGRFSNSLTHLNISSCGFTGDIPWEILFLPKLVSLDLSSNNGLQMHPYVLNNLLQNSTHLREVAMAHVDIEEINLGFNLFSGGLPLELFKCRSLKVLLLRDQNLFDGEVNQGLNSSLFIQLVNLNFLDLQSNSFKGVWNFETLLSSLPNLTGLDLSYSGLTVLSHNSTTYVNPNFWFLNLASCNLNAFPKSLRAMKNLQYLLLYGNNIQGRIPDLAGEIGGNRLIAVDLSNNSITGLPQFQWDGITQLSFQSNMIQGPFPPSICNMSNLQYLDLSNNSIDGVIPQCIGNIHSLGMLHLGANLFNGTIPDACTDYGQLTWFMSTEN